MANHLPKEKQVQIIAALAECNSIRSIERQTGVHRDTIMRLGVRVGEACQVLLDEKMRGLTSSRIEIDELWGFIRMKEKTANACLAPMELRRRVDVPRHRPADQSDPRVPRREA